MAKANAFKIGDQVRITGRSLTFHGKRFKGMVGEVVGSMTKHEVFLWRVKFDDGEALYEEKDIKHERR